MTNIEELDLLALADGHLDDDPARKSAIEAALDGDPVAAARLAEYRAQTAALRAAYAGKLAEPVPERLRAVLEGADAAPVRPVFWRAAASLLIVAAGLGGWLLGQGQDDPARRALLDESYRDFVQHGPELIAPLRDAAAGRPEQAISWIDEEVAIRLSAPDLSSQGFSLIGKRGIRDGTDRLVALDYRSRDGRAFSLFIAPRWTNQLGPITDQERNGISLAYWHDGPLAASIATQLPLAEARMLAEAVRQAMRDDATAPSARPQLDFRPLRDSAEDVMADSLGLPPGDQIADPFSDPLQPTVEAN